MMKDKRMAIMALLSVLLMAFTPLAVAGSGSDAVSSGGVSPLPEPVDYMYVLTTDSNNIQITSVKASVNGSALEVKSSARTSSASIPDFWAFDRNTGMGPFNSFYAAINLYSGSGLGTDNGETKLSNIAGAIAFVLDPYDLSKTLKGTVFDKTKYNVMLIVPTVYWKADGTTLYLSSSSSYNAGGTSVSGMIAYAHSAGDGKAFTNVYPYIGIGVYEASLDSGMLLSKSGMAPAASKTNDQFKGYADALTPAANSDYQQWNFYQWTLYKMMAYTVMGTKNSQMMMGSGPVSGSSASTTGLADSAGPYASATSSYSKLFIENSWGSLFEFVGDTAFSDGALCTGNALGGTTLDSAGARQTSAGASLPPHGWISGASASSETWDLPVSSQSSDNSSDFSAPGDYVWSVSGWRSLFVGGRWDYGSSAGLAYADGDFSLSFSISAVGARLAYVMAADAAALIQVQYTYHPNSEAGSPMVLNQSILEPVHDCMFDAPRGKAFSGWNTEADGTGIQYSYRDIHIPSASEVSSGISLYAQWEDVSGVIPEGKEYMYALSTDDANIAVTKVQASENGSRLMDIYSGTNTKKGNIDGYWDFDRITGMGPFNSFYAAINIKSGKFVDSGETKLNSAVGTIAFVLNPYDLSKTIKGTVYTKSDYNVMLIVPTVYWKVEGITLYLSSSPSYGAGGTSVSGMTAYAHSAGDNKAFTNVYPYIGIGVYEATVSDGKLLSMSGQKPTASRTNDQFKTYADALVPAANSDYQQWNFYQWTLYKMMSYTVMGTKNSQALMGDGPVSGWSASMTGLADSAGPYASATPSYSKILIENPWGSLYESVGDTCFYDREIYTGNALGGQNLGNQVSTGYSIPELEKGWISTTYMASELWDLPKSYQSSDNSSSIFAPGDYSWSGPGWCYLYVGGCFYNISPAGIASASCDTNFSYSHGSVGARLAYVMADDAVAPAMYKGGLAYISVSGGVTVSDVDSQTSAVVMLGSVDGKEVASIDDRVMQALTSSSTIVYGYPGTERFFASYPFYKAIISSYLEDEDGGSDGNEAGWVFYMNGEDGTLQLFNVNGGYCYADAVGYKGSETVIEIIIGDGIDEVKAGSFSSLKSVARVKVGPDVKTIGQGAFDGVSLQSIYFAGNYTPGLDYKFITGNVEDHYGGDGINKHLLLFHSAGDLTWDGIDVYDPSATSLADLWSNAEKRAGEELNAWIERQWNGWMRPVLTYGDVDITNPVDNFNHNGALGIKYHTSGEVDDEYYVNGYESDCSDRIVIPGDIFFVHYRPNDAVVKHGEITSIGAGAFNSRQSSALKSITIPATVKTINKNAFSGCVNLETLFFLGEMPTIIGEIDGSLVPKDDCVVVYTNAFGNNVPLELWGHEAKMAAEVDADSMQTVDDCKMYYTLSQDRTAIVGKRQSAESDSVSNTSGFEGTVARIPDFVYNATLLPYKVIGFDRYAFYKNANTKTIVFGEYVGEGETNDRPAVQDCTFREMVSLEKIRVTGGNEHYYASYGIPEPIEYLYAIKTDSNNVKVEKVQASESGSPLRDVYSDTNTKAGYIDDYWNFDAITGMGPFNSFYAAINITGGSPYDANDEYMRDAKMSQDAGKIAFVLDPYNLSMTLGGTEFKADDYNVMLIIPTVYWKSENNVLYLSNSPSYTAGSISVSGMLPHAHTASKVSSSFWTTYSDVTYPYMGIGVYEASVDNERLLSKSGVVPTANKTCDDFRSYTNNLTPEANSDYQQWNFYQWTLYKMMCYTVMGTKNSQMLMGDGPVSNSSALMTGLADLAGPYGMATPSYSKLFVENPWGSLSEYVGDTAIKDGTLYAGNYLGGRSLVPEGNLPSIDIVLPSSGYITGTQTSSKIWDFPCYSESTNNNSNYGVPGDYVRSDTGWCSLSVGGAYSYGKSDGVAFVYGYQADNPSPLFGSRLAYMMSEDAVIKNQDTKWVLYRTYDELKFQVNIAGEDLKFDGFSSMSYRSNDGSELEGDPRFTASGEIKAENTATITYAFSDKGRFTDGEYMELVVSLACPADVSQNRKVSLRLSPTGSETDLVLYYGSFDPKEVIEVGRSGVITLAGLALEDTSVSSKGAMTLIKAPSNLSKFVINKNAVIIERYAFAGSSISVADIGKVDIIGSHAFYDCINLTKIVRSSTNPLYVEDSAFENCHGLANSASLVARSVYIGDSAFYNANLSGEVSIPVSVAYVGSMAFAHNYGIVSFSVGDPDEWSSSDVEIPETDFEHAYDVRKGVLLFLKDNGYRVLQYPAGSPNTSIIFSEDLEDQENNYYVTHVYPYAFYGASNLEKVVLSDHTAIVGREAFAECSSLKEFTFGTGYYGSEEFRENDDSGKYTYNMFGNDRALAMIRVPVENVDFCADGNGVLYSKDLSVLYCYPAGNQRVSFALPEETSKIYDYAFANNTSIRRVVVTSEGPVSIGSSAFANCTRLQEVYYLCDSLPMTGEKIYDNSSAGLVSYFGEGKGIVSASSWQSRGIEEYSIISELSQDSVKADIYEFVVVGSDGCAIPGAELYLYYNGIQWSKVTDGYGLVPIAFYDMFYTETIDGEEMAAEPRDVTVKVLKDGYYPYLQKATLNADTMVSFIKLMLEPRLEGVSCEEEDLNDGPVMVNLAEMSDGISMFDKDGNALGKNGKALGEETIDIEFVAYTDKSADSCAAYVSTDRDWHLNKEGSELGKDYWPAAAGKTFETKSKLSTSYSVSIPYSKLKAGDVVHMFLVWEGGDHKDEIAKTDALDIVLISAMIDEDKVVADLGEANIDLTSGANDKGMEMFLGFIQGLLPDGLNLGSKDNGVSVRVDGTQVTVSFGIGISKSSSSSTTTTSGGSNNCEAGYKNNITGHHGNTYRFPFYAPAILKDDKIVGARNYGYSLANFGISVKDLLNSSEFDSGKLLSALQSLDGVTTSQNGCSYDLQKFNIWFARGFGGDKSTYYRLSYSDGTGCDPKEVCYGVVPIGASSRPMLGMWVPIIVGYYICEGKALAFEKPTYTSKTEKSQSLSVRLEGNMVFLYEDGRLHLDECNVKGSLAYRFTASHQTYIATPVVVIPIHLSAEFNANADLRLTFLYDDTGGTVYLDNADLNVALSLDLRAGIGVDWISAGIYGKAGFVMNMSLHPFYMKKMTLSGEIGFYYEFIFFKGELKILDGTWTLYEYQEDATMSKLMASAPLMRMGASASQPEERVENLVDSAAETFVYNGEEYTIHFVDVTSDPSMFTLLDAYGNERFDDSNYQKIRIDKLVAGQWRPWASLDDEARNDVSFIVGKGASDDPVIVYSYKEKRASSSDANSYMLSSDIGISYASVKDILDGKAPVQISAGTGPYKGNLAYGYDRESGAETIMWTENSDCSIFGTSPYSYIDSNGQKLVYETTANSVWKAVVGGGSEPIQVAFGLGPVTDLSPLPGGKVAYVEDADYDLSTTDDRVMVVVDSAGNTVETPGVMYVDFADGAAYYYYSHPTDLADEPASIVCTEDQIDVEEQIPLGEGCTVELSVRYADFGDAEPSRIVFELCGPDGAAISGMNTGINTDLKRCLSYSELKTTGDTATFILKVDEVYYERFHHDGYSIRLDVQGHNGSILPVGARICLVPVKVQGLYSIPESGFKALYWDVDGALAGGYSLASGNGLAALVYRSSHVAADAAGGSSTNCSVSALFLDGDEFRGPVTLSEAPDGCDGCAIKSLRAQIYDRRLAAHWDWTGDDSSAVLSENRMFDISGSVSVSGCSIDHEGSKLVVTAVNVGATPAIVKLYQVGGETKETAIPAGSEMDMEIEISGNGLVYFESGDKKECLGSFDMSYCDLRVTADHIVLGSADHILVTVSNERGQKTAGTISCGPGILGYDSGSYSASSKIQFDEIQPGEHRSFKVLLESSLMRNGITTVRATPSVTDIYTSDNFAAVSCAKADTDGRSASSSMNGMAVDPALDNYSGTYVKGLGQTAGSDGTYSEGLRIGFCSGTGNVLKRVDVYRVSSVPYVKGYTEQMIPVGKECELQVVMNYVDFGDDVPVPSAVRLMLLGPDGSEAEMSDCMAVSDFRVADGTATFAVKVTEDYYSLHHQAGCRIGVYVYGQDSADLIASSLFLVPAGFTEQDIGQWEANGEADLSSFIEALNAGVYRVEFAFSSEKRAVSLTLAYTLSVQDQYKVAWIWKDENDVFVTMETNTNVMPFPVPAKDGFEGEWVPTSLEGYSAAYIETYTEVIELVRILSDEVGKPFVGKAEVCRADGSISYGDPKIKKDFYIGAKKVVGWELCTFEKEGDDLLDGGRLISIYRSSISWTPANAVISYDSYNEAIARSGMDGKFALVAVYGNDTAPAMEVTVDGLVFGISGSEAAVIGYEGKPSSVAIPAAVTVEGIDYRVTSVEAGAFFKCTSLKDLDLGRVYSIGDQAFYGCTSLEHAVVPSALESVGQNAFKNVIFVDRDGFTELSHDAAGIAGKEFCGKRAVLVDEAPVSEVSFSYGGVDYTITGRNTVAAVGLSSDATDAASIDIPATVKNGKTTYVVSEIADWAFAGAGLESVSLPDGICIGNGAFYECSSLSSIDLSSASAIGIKSFARCSSLTSLMVSADIGSYAFFGCSSLETLVVEEGVESIGDSAFSGCASFKSVTLPGSLSYIGTNAFNRCTFYGSDGLALPKTAEGLGGGVYVGEGSILSIPMEIGTTALVDGLRYTVTSCDPYEASLIGYEGEVVSLSVPDSIHLFGKEVAVVSIGPKAFYSCATVVSADLGSVASVGYKAFANCSALKTLVVPDTVKDFGEYSFYGCKRLTSLEIPGDDVVLEASAFSACVRMKTISFTGSGATIERNAFYKNNGVESVDLSTVASIGYKAFPYCKGLTSLTIPGGIESLGAYAFYSCENLRDLSIEEGVKAIGKSAFSECNALESVSFPDSLESVGKNAFYKIRFYDGGGKRLAADAGSLAGRTFEGIGDLVLREVVLEGHVFASGGVSYEVTSADAVCAIGYAGGVLSLPSSVTYSGREWAVTAVGDSAFRLCKTISSLDLSNVASIGAKAFSGCSGLTSVTFSDGLSSVGSNAFNGTLFYDGGSTVPRTAAGLAGHAFEGSGGSLYAVVSAEGSTFADGGIVYQVLSQQARTVSAVGIVADSEPTALPSSVRHLGYTWDVTAVGDAAFRLCATISELDLSNAETIGAKAFSGCSGLTSVTFSDGLSSVGSNAFNGTLFYDGGSTVPRTAAGLSGHSFVGSGGSLHLVS